MTDKKTYDPYETFKKLNQRWETQMNDFIHLWTNNKEFVRLSKMNTDSHVQFMDMFRKSQELWAAQLNLPTKTDLANVSKMAIQTEEKLDLLEEQIWNLSDSVTSKNKEMEEMVEVSQEIIKLTKQLKTELTRTKKEINSAKQLKEEIQEMREELASLSFIRDEVADIKELLRERKEEITKELVNTGN